ncbi:MAG: mechanosensitive ion channel [Clostridia bacterium]|nr:mechanosensitive ion channel [Clostridia bacterium]
MEGRKTQHNTVKNVIQYVFLLVFVGLTIVAYIFRNEINNFFSADLTNVDLINQFLHLVPTFIISIQIIVLAIVLNMLIRLLAKLTFGLTDKGKTISNILTSLIKWIIIIGAILWILSVWGVNTTALLAGAGILALIIGLGAQSLIADILAGIFIVFEGEYVVGDIVVIDGWRGKIVNIGIRTTQLEDNGGDIKIINNSEIKSVINQTKHKSVAVCNITFASNEKLENVENIIKSALPEMKAKIPTITDDIIYKGVTKITEGSIELLFHAKCFEEDIYQVQRDLYRELKLVLDNNNIPSFATPSINVEEHKNKVLGE